MTEPPLLDKKEIPPFVIEDGDLYRWRLCVGVSHMIAGKNDLLLAQEIYFDPNIPTTPAPPAENGTIQEAGWTEALHPRGRGGKWISKLGRLSSLAHVGPIGRAPPQHLTESYMRGRGYDRIPDKGKMALDVLGDAYDTHMLHRPPGDLSHLPPEMRYTEERMKSVHEPIVKALVDSHASQEHPHALVVCGGPASGKSTLLRRAPQIEPHDAVHLDADEIRSGKPNRGHHGIPEAVDMLDAHDPYAAWGSHREAGDILEKAEQAAIAKHANIVLDQTGDSNPDEFVKQLERLSNEGYAVDMVYVATPTERAVAQNIYRAETEGRYVPTPTVREKHRMVAKNFRDRVTKLNFIDSVAVYDPEFGLIGYRDPDTGDMIPVHEAGYARWMAKADEPEQHEQVPRRPRPEPEQKGLEEAISNRPGTMSQEPEGPVIWEPFELESREAAHERFDKLAAEAAKKKPPESKP